MVFLFDVWKLIIFCFWWDVHLQVKPLGVIWGKYETSYNRKNTIMFDDIGRNFLMNPQNGLKVVWPFSRLNYLHCPMYFLSKFTLCVRSDLSWRPISTERRTESSLNWLNTWKRSPSLMTSADWTTNTGRGRHMHQKWMLTATFTAVSSM